MYQPRSDGLEWQIAQKRHAVRRFLHRYPTISDFSGTDYDLICETLKERIGQTATRRNDHVRAELISFSPPRLSTWAMIFKGECIFVAFDHQNHSIPTFLPPPGHKEYDPRGSLRYAVIHPIMKQMGVPIFIDLTKPGGIVIGKPKAAA